MSATFVSGAAAAPAGSVTNLTINAPASIVAGNLLIAHISAVATPTAPSGWTLLGSTSIGGGVNEAYVYSKTATGSEPSTYTWTLSQFRPAGVILQYSGAAVDGTPVFTSASYPQTTYTTASLTPTTSSDLWLVCCCDVGGNATTPSTPSGFTSRTNVNSGSTSTSMYCFEATLSSLSATGTTTGTWSGNSQPRTYSLLLQSAVVPVAVASSSSNGATGGGTSVTITAPTGIVTGDVLLAFIGCASSSPTYTPPSGWSFLGSGGGPEAAVSATYIKVATGSEPTSYTFTGGSTGNWIYGTILRLTGASGAETAGALYGGTGGSTTAATAPSQTPTQTNDLLVTWWLSVNGHTFSTPSGMTVGPTYTTPWAAVADIFYETLATTSATGAISSTISAADSYVSASVLIQAGAPLVPPVATLSLGPLTMTATGAVPPISITQLTSGQWSSSTGATTASVSASGAGMVIVAINTETNGSTPSSFTVTGLGLTWSLRSRNQTFSGRGQSTEVWYALAGSSISGTIALSGSVNTDDGTWHVLFVTGATTPPRWDTNPSLPASAKSPGTQVVSTDAPVPYVLIFAGNGTNSHNSSPTPVSTSLGIVSNGGGTNWEYSDVWGGTPGQLASTTAGCGSVGSFPTVVVDALTQGVNASLALGPLTTHAVITATGTVTVALGPVAISAITTTSTETLALGPLTTTATGMVLQPTRYYCAINSGLAIVDYTLWYSTFFSLQTWGSGSFLGPQSVAVSPDGRWLAITNTGTQVQFGDLTVPLPAPGAAAIAGPIITTGLSSVNAGVWAPDSSKAYFQGAGAVQSSNQTGAVLGPVWTVAGATGLTQLAISTDGTKLYCTCGTSVKQVDTTSGAVTATYSGLTGAMGICISPDNTMLYVSDGLTSGNIYPITIATGTVGTPLAANNPQGLCVSPDGSTLWSAQQGSNQVQAIATSSFTVTHTIGSITSPKAIAVARDGTSVLVSTSAANVIPISTSTFTAGAALSVPQAALGISVQPITGRAYCSLGPLFTEANTTVPLSLGPFILESPPVPAPAASGFFAYGAITSGTTLTMTWQPSTAAIVGGHLLLMFIASTTAVPPYTPPAGWTSAGYVSSAGYNAQLFWKTATGPTGSEPSNYTVTMSSSSVSVGVIADYANANQLDGPIGMVSSPAGSSTYTFAGLTTAGFHRKWIGFAGFASGTSPVQPGGTTLEASYHPTTLWDHVYDQTWLVAPPALPIVNNQPNAGNPNPPYVTIDCLIYQGPVQLAPSNLVEGPLSLVAYGTGSCSVPLGPLAVNAIGTVMPPNPIVFCCNGTTSMKVLDAVTGTLVGTLAMARSEYYAAVSPNGHYMAVTSVSDLSQFPPSSTTVQPFVQFVTTTGYGLGNVAIGPILVLGSENLYGLSMAWAADSSKVYVEGQIPGTLGSGGGAIQASSPTGVMTDYAGVNYAQFNGYAVMSPDGQYLYCTGKDGSGTLWIQQVVTLGDANFNSWSGFVGTQLYGICISPDGGTLYVSNGATSGLVYSVNIATGVVTGMSVGNGPMGLALSPDGRTLYCALHGGGQVAVINTFTMAVTQTISGFTNPARVAVTPDGSVLWVTNYTTGNVTPVNTSTFALGTPVSVGSNATDVAIVPAFNGVLGTATLSLGPLTTTAMGIGGTTFCTLGPLVLSATGAVGATAAVRLGPVKVRAGLAVIVAGANASSTHSLMGSADGTTWTIIPNPADGGSYVSVWGVAYNHTNGSWVAVDSGDASTPAKVLMTSPNGTTWTSRSTPFDGDYGQSVVWAEGVWVAAGGSTTSSHSVIATSPDGVTWTARTTPFDGSSGYVNQVGTNFYASPNRLIVAVGNDNAGVKVVMTSPDGVTWTAQTTPFDSGYGAAVWWDGHNWLVGGRNSAKTRTIMTSPNGIVWTLRTTPFDAPKDGTANPAVWDIAGNGAGLLVAVGQAGYHGGPMICTSADHGVTWTARDHPFTHPSGGGAAAPPGWAVAWVPAIGLWVLGSGSAASGPQVVATSPDAITWTAALTPFDGPGPAGSPPVGFVNMINPTGPQTVYPPVPLPAEQGSPGFIPVWD